MKGWSLRDAVGIGHACIQVIDHGDGKPFTWAEASEKAAGPLHGLNAAQLRDVATYLACQAVGMERSLNADAILAMAQISNSVRDYEKRRASKEAS